MNHSTTFTAELDQIEEDIFHEISDEALEAAGTNITAQTVTAFYFCYPPTSDQWCPA